MPVRLYDLWGEVLRGTAECPGTIVHDFSEAEVCQAEVTTRVKEKVLGFEVPVDDIK
jgi:hypothetical protein